MGAGILPITIINNKIFLLFGKENKYNDTPGWSDFSGGSEKNETQFETALREGSEELTGFLGSKSDLERMITENGNYEVEIRKYKTFIFPMEYNPFLTFYYNNNQKFLQEHLDASVIKKSKIFEKEEICWIALEELLKNKKIFRSFYQENIMKIFGEKDKIEKFARSILNSKGRYKSMIVKFKNVAKKTRKKIYK